MLVLIPAVIVYVTQTRKTFIIHQVVVNGIASIVLGPMILAVGLFFLLPAIVMGSYYKGNASAPKVVRAVTITLLAELLLEFILLKVWFKISLLDEFRKVMIQVFTRLKEDGLLASNITIQPIEEIVQPFVNSIPMTLIVVSFVYAIITHAIVRPILTKANVSAPSLLPIKDWMLPRIFVFYYLIAIIADYMVTDEGNSYWTVVLLNLIPLMKFTFTIQAIGFIYFIAHERGWYRIVPFLSAVLIVIFPPLNLIGVVDAAFHIRNAFKKQ
jgi:uncharacterized protein YybS (DUF2232 family)